MTDQSRLAITDIYDAVVVKIGEKPRDEIDLVPVHGQMSLCADCLRYNSVGMIRQGAIVGCGHGVGNS